MTEAVHVIGAGGHARVVLAALAAAGRPIAGAFDDDSLASKRLPAGVRFLGATRDAASPAVVAIGHNGARARIAAGLDLRWVAVVHPWTWIAPDATVGEGAVIMAGAVVQPGAVIGAHAIVNTGARIDHDTVLGTCSHAAPGAILTGAVTVGERVLIGAGAVVLPNVSIGADATIGAGAIVTRDVEAGTAFVGPAMKRAQEER